MEVSQQQLLENLLDALDHLYDQKLAVYDLYSLLYATCAALPNVPVRDHVQNACERVLAVLGTRNAENEMNQQALVATDELRAALGDASDSV